MDADADVDSLLRQVRDAEAGDRPQEAERHLRDVPNVLVAVPVRQPRHAQVAVANRLDLKKKSHFPTY